MLPARVHYKNGAYYYVHKNKWTHLGRSVGDMAVNLRDIEDYPRDIQGVELFIRRLYYNCRSNSKSRRGRKGKDFEITLEDVLTLGRDSRMRCAVTGTPFDLTIDSKSGKRPFAPSIDRVDSEAGYVPGNVRLVCVATNYALNSWGEHVFKKLARNYVNS